ncbi:tripartite tricarboxylate transporter substrate binding protein [Pararhodobacter zhoushanensis]|uniref:Tripartite tricarboxylate transporter substrate binding protein n=1 Tax=Pararhodobacter zhoushanensis TaxID=2479545 RepID=A0ABT3GXL0_9RHOB|nr:tripartite tricarboxylate transporter substrate binding protein [Pararhodobacter zhoushanensis]MCW1932262.1 tripartite tricarboxylate transporter substrate binding protein [Pararhodobacter zhoushanensis]
MTKTLLTLSTALLALMPLAAAAEYPERPVEFIVPWPPGDLEDVLTRMIADRFQATYGVPAAVVNKPGGGGGPFPGAVDVALAPADGYTVGSFVIDVPLVGPHIGIPPLTPNPFDPIGIFVTYPFVIATSGDAPYQTLQELAAYAQDHAVSLGHFGDETTPARHSMALAQALGFSYASSSAFDMLDCNTLASGDADVINTTLQLIRPCLDSLTILAAVTNERISILPDVPTAGEIVPELDVSTWNGLFVRSDTPQDARDRIAAVAAEVMASDEATQLAADTGALIYWMDAAASQEQMARDVETLGRISAFLGE